MLEKMNDEIETFEMCPYCNKNIKIEIKRDLLIKLSKFIKCPKCGGSLEKVTHSFNMYKCNVCGKSTHGSELILK